MRHAAFTIFFCLFLEKDGLEAFTNNTPLYSLIQRRAARSELHRQAFFFPRLCFTRWGEPGLDAGREEGSVRRHGIAGRRGHPRAGQRARPRPSWAGAPPPPRAPAAGPGSPGERGRPGSRAGPQPPPPPRAPPRAARWPGPGAARRGGGGCSPSGRAPRRLCARASLSPSSHVFVRLPGRALGAPGAKVGMARSGRAGRPPARSSAGRRRSPFQARSFPSFRNSLPLGSPPPLPRPSHRLGSPPRQPCEPNPRLVSPGSSEAPPQSASLPAGPALGFTCCLFSSQTGPLTLPPLSTSSLTLSGTPGSNLSPSRSGCKVWDRALGSGVLGSSTWASSPPSPTRAVQKRTP